MPHPSGNGGSRVLVFRQTSVAEKRKWHTDICVLREYQKVIFSLRKNKKQKKLQSGFLR